MAKTILIKDTETGEEFLLYTVDARERSAAFPERFVPADDEAATILRRPKSNTTKKDVLSGNSPDVTNPPSPEPMPIKHADKSGGKN